MSTYTQLVYVYMSGEGLGSEATSASSHYDVNLLSDTSEENGI